MRSDEEENPDVSFRIEGFVDVEEFRMPAKRKTLAKVKSEAALRASVSFHPDVYNILEQIA